MAHAPVGVGGNSTNAPGDLRRSIIVTGPVPAPDGWAGEVGPTMIYGRQRELGGPIFPKSASALKFTKFGTVYVIGPSVIPSVSIGHVFMRRPGVYQKPEPYMLPGYLEVMPSLPAVVDGNISAAIGG